LGGSGQSIIVDLTRSLDASFVPYADGGYVDPPLTFSEWSSLQKEGFRVTQMTLGTQSGTHIDAPAHFLTDGACLETLSPEHLVGSFFLIDLSGKMPLADPVRRLREYRGEKILFLRTAENQLARMTRDLLQKILSLPPLLLVLSGRVVIEDAAPFSFNRLVAGASKYLTEDLDEQAAHQIAGEGEMFVLPLKLAGVSGSPCRVVVRMNASPGAGNCPTL